MGPIEKKILEFIKSENISEGTKQVLLELHKEVKPMIQKEFNNAYLQGYDHKEFGKPRNSGYYQTLYPNFSFKSSSLSKVND